MAVDEAVWQAVAQGRSPPTLRLYAWEPPCLSLGRNQPIADIDRAALQLAGYDLVRRPTGGQAILHGDELTYGVMVQLKDPRVQGDVLTSCQRLSRGLVDALALLGVSATAAHLGRVDTPSPVCFENPGDFEVLANGQKLIGSAQMRASRTLLQHGTLPLHGDIARIHSFLSLPIDPHRLRTLSTTLAEVVGQRVPWERAAQAVARGFAQALNLQLEPSSLTPEEQDTAQQLRTEKYSSEEWTARL